MKPKSARKTGHLPNDSPGGDQPPWRPSALAPLRSLKLILVPVDFSDCSFRALDYAAELARTFRAKLILLHVLQPSIHTDNYLGDSATMDQSNGTLIAATRAQLGTLTHHAATQGLVAEVLVRMGRAQSDIADTANATGADLIVMGAHGGGAENHPLLGGTAERVLRHSPCPVLTVPYPINSQKRL